MIFKAGMDAMYASRTHRMLAPVFGGRGIIFTMHHVRPGQPSEFAPNRILEIEPEFLEAVVTQIRWAGLDIVSLDEAVARLADRSDRGRFAVLTFDDGYRDNLEVAYPILKRLDAPFCVYVATSLPDGTADLWWLGLEAVIADNDAVVCEMDDGPCELSCETDADKNAAYEQIYWWLRGCDQDRQRTFIQALCADHGIDLQRLCTSLSMTWQEIADLARDPLVTIGAHTMGHYALARLDAERARNEMTMGADIIADKIGYRPDHFSYPYGDPGSAGPREFEMARRLGFRSAVTTRPGVLFGDHSDHLTSLPRVSLNGEYQASKYLELFLSGAPFALYNRFRRVNAA